ncbi:MAG: hypothetical protein COB14_02330 [Alphaproteobacteria bacterium]|nr:MAG: hypothetical protein COB14_02330 [Alphaproteobacteria bacterium]
MKRFAPLFSIVAAFCLSSCVAENKIQQQLDLLTPNMSALNPTVKEMHGIILKVKGCQISNTRIATCHFTATSKYQDRTLNLLGGNYTKIQDDTGVSYDTMIAFGKDATDRTQRSTMLIADTPYNFTMMAQNISTQATKVRAVTINRMDVTGTSHAARYIRTNFAHPPVMSSATMQQPIQTNVQDTTPIAKAQQQNPTSTPHGTTPYTYLFARIVPINEHVPVDAGIKAFWGNGAYLYLSPDGRLGHNWSKPGSYAYVPKQTWHVKNNHLVIVFDQISYSFDLSDKTSPMVTYLDQGGAFKMSAYPKVKNQK